MNTIKKFKISILSGLIISHVLISLLFILYLVLGLPFPNHTLFISSSLSSSIICSTLITCIPYLICGFLYTLISKSISKNILNWLFYSICFSLILLVVWFICYIPYINGIDGSVWFWYAIINTPGGLIVPLLSDVNTIESPLYALSAILPSILFFIGMIAQRISKSMRYTRC